MNINLTPDLENLVRSKVESGLFNSASEVVRAALRLLVQEDERREAALSALRAEVAEGVTQAKRGEFVDGEKVMEEIRAYLQSMRESSEKAG